MAAFFGFGGTPVDIEINLHGEEGRKQIEQKGEKDKKETCAVYLDGESVAGQASSESDRSARPSRQLILVCRSVIPYRRPSRR